MNIRIWSLPDDRSCKFEAEYDEYLSKLKYHDIVSPNSYKIDSDAVFHLDTEYNNVLFNSGVLMTNTSSFVVSESIGTKISTIFKGNIFIYPARVIFSDRTIMYRLFTSIHSIEIIDTERSRDLVTALNGRIIVDVGSITLYYRDSVPPIFRDYRFPSVIFVQEKYERLIIDFFSIDKFKFIDPSEHKRKI